MALRHAPRLRRNLLEIALAGEEQQHRIILDVVLLVERCTLSAVMMRVAALGRVLLDDLLQLLDDDIADLRLGFDDFLQLFNLVFECFGLLRALQDILLVDVAQADIRQ